MKQIRGQPFSIYDTVRLDSDGKGTVPARVAIKKSVPAYVRGRRRCQPSHIRHTSSG
jgi:hypothetical protein